MTSKDPLWTATRVLATIVFVGSATNAFAAVPSAAERMSAEGPELRSLRSEVGTWNVIASIWPNAGGEPIVTRNLIAQRVMIGPYLQEIMRPAPGSPGPDFRRIDYLNFDRVEGRWKYVSMDTRFPVSIMPASSYGSVASGDIVLRFDPQAFVGFGTEIEGRFMASEMTIARKSTTREIKEQTVNMAIGNGAPRLLARYEYIRD